MPEKGSKSEYNKGVKKGKLPRIIFMVIIFFIAFFVYKYRTVVYAQINELKFSPIGEHFTELYFNNYYNLPNKLVAEKPFYFSFTVHNQEGRSKIYPYRVYVILNNSEMFIIDKNTMKLEDNEQKTINEKYNFSNQAKSAIFYIELTELNQEIHFKLNNN
jgi:hypothetical protein